MFCPPKVQKNVKDAHAYLTQHLLAGDYYGAGEITKPRWFGKLAPELVSDMSRVSPEDFKALTDGRTLSGLDLVKRRSEDRRCFTDFTVSADKSVSVAACVMGDHRIMAAHQAAVEKSRAYIIEHAAVRVRMGGVELDDACPNMVVGAEFMHDSARPVKGVHDPLLHTHNLIFNVTKDPATGEWKALQNSGICQAIPAATALYRHEMAQSLQRLGYELEDRGPLQGFRIKGISQEVCDLYSQRTAAIETLISKKEKALGRELSEKEKDIIVHESRNKKTAPDDPNHVRELQTGKLTPEQRAELDAVKTSALARAETGGVTLPQKVSARDALADAVDHLTERQSVFLERDLLAYSLDRYRGRIDFDALRTEMGAMLDRGELLRNGAEMTSREMLAVENSMLSLCRDGAGRYAAPVPGREVPVMEVGGKFKLTEEQRAAVAHIWGSRDFAVSVRGLAGTGKTSGLQTAVRGLTDAGVTSHIYGTSGGAVSALRDDGFSAADTVQSLLADPRKQAALGRGDVVLLDEAGMLSAREMNRFLGMCHKAGARVALVGDTRQHAPVGAGDSLRILESQGAVRMVELRQINRQKFEAHRRIAALAADHKAAESFDALNALGGIEERGADLHATLAKYYLNDLAAGKSALIVSPTWAEIDSINLTVRAEMQFRGLLGEERDFTSEVSKKLTKSQLKDSRNYEAGDVLAVRKDTALVGKGKWEVLAKDGERVTLKSDRGRSITVDFSKQSLSASVMDLSEKKNLRVAVGDTLLLRGTDKKLGLINGALLKITALEKDGSMRAIDSKGKERTIPANFKAAVHGYAITSHAAQGKTVDRVYVSMKNFSTVTKNLWYVALTRAREKMVVMTGDKASLREAITGSAERKAAVELLAERAAKNQISERMPVSLRASMCEKLAGAWQATKDLFARRALAAEKAAARPAEKAPAPRAAMPVQPARKAEVAKKPITPIVETEMQRRQRLALQRAAALRQPGRENTPQRSPERQDPERGR